MAAKTLTREQRDKVIELLAARETYQSIADKVGCSWSNIDYYAKRYGGQIAKAREEHDARQIDRGLRARERRIDALERVALAHEKILLREPDPTKNPNDKGGLYATEIKMSATGSTVEYQVYNAPAVNQYRGLIKDISEETQGRILRVAPTDPTGTKPYDGGSALNKLESTIAGLAARMAAQSSPFETDGEGSGEPAV